MTYAFRCRVCQHEFEVTATVAEYEARGAPACPRCGRAGARRVFTPIMVMSGTAASGRSSGAPPDPSSSGGCCGGSCGCRH